MAEYINRDAVRTEACKGCTMHGDNVGECYNSDSCERLLAAFMNARLADVVPVVRCKDCKAWISFMNDPDGTIFGTCELCENYRNEDDFCSYAVRKDVD